MKNRFSLVAFLLALMLLAGCAVALAEEDIPPANQISENLTFSLVEWYRDVMPLDDTLKLTRMTAAISKVDSTHVAIRGVTQANMSCILVGGYMTIQQWKNNQWNTYTTVSFKAYGTNEAEAEITKPVASGYYYRLTIAHYADVEGASVSGGTITKSVLVN